MPQCQQPHLKGEAVGAFSGSGNSPGQLAGVTAVILQFTLAAPCATAPIWNVGRVKVSPGCAGPVSVTWSCVRPWPLASSCSHPSPAVAMAVFDPFSHCACEI